MCHKHTRHMNQRQKASVCIANVPPEGLTTSRVRLGRKAREVVSPNLEWKAHTTCCKHPRRQWTLATNATHGPCDCLAEHATTRRLRIAHGLCTAKITGSTRACETPRNQTASVLSGQTPGATSVVVLLAKEAIDFLKSFKFNITVAISQLFNHSINSSVRCNSKMKHSVPTLLYNFHLPCMSRKFLSPSSFNANGVRATPNASWPLLAFHACAANTHHVNQR